MSKFFLHTILLILSAAGVYYWLAVPALSQSTLQLVAVLVLSYFAAHAFKNRQPKLGKHNLITLDLTILTCMILLLVSQTGGLPSPLFFLVYFLLFGVSMLYEIEATLVLTGVLILFFLFTTDLNLGDLTHLSQLLALIMITPLAIFTGHQYETILEAKKIQATLHNHLKNQETDALLFLSLNLKSTLISALDSLSILIPKSQLNIRHNLENLYQDLRQLYKAAGELEVSIDQETDG